jgi:two-component system, cell cycle sensor histidine kinase and response regulator CckA
MADADPERADRASDVEIAMTERFSALFEHMQEGVALHEVICDGDGQPIDYRILDVNDQYERHTGMKRADAAGRLASVLYGTGTPPYLEEFCSVGMGGPPKRLEVYFAPLQRHFSISVAQLGPRAFATIFSDVTLEKEQARVIEEHRLSMRALLDNQPHLAWLKDREGRFLAVNKAFSDACGQPSPDAVVGKTDFDVWPSEFAAAYRADDAAVMASLAQKAVEEPIANVDGTRWFETYKSPVYAPDGTIVGTTGVARDITERRLAQQAAEKARQELARYFSLSIDLLCIANTDGRFLRLNPAWTEVLGYPLAELEGSRFLDLVHPDDLEPTIEAIGRLKNGETVAGFQNRYRHVDGSYHWIEWRSVADDQGVIYATAGDITRRRKDELALRAAERAAARSREQLLSIAELAHIGHFTIDVDIGTVTWTAELCRIAGVEPNSFVPSLEAARATIHPDDFLAVEAAIEAAARDQTATRLHNRIVRPNGEVRYCLAIIEGDADAAGKTRVLGLVQDLSELRRAEEERRKLEQQVMQAQKLESLGVLAGGIAHDFNNLLTSILGNADLALSELSPANPACIYLDDIEKVSRRAADLCRQMLAYSGKGRFVVQPLSFNEVVREMAYLLSVSISKKVVIKYNFCPELPSVMADATQLRQVVMNLITNASEAIDEASGVVTLSTGVIDCDDAYLTGAVGYRDPLPVGQYVYLEVADTGCGMTPETIARIFDPFFTTKFTGRGLGLAAVLGIVRGHRGALRVYSEPGQGTTFKLLFPAADQQAESIEGKCAVPPEEWKGQGLLLLADDEESIRNMGLHILRRAGFEVLTAADGREAVDLFELHHDRIRLVVLDMTMPHLDGEACFRELRRIEPNVKVIMTSGYNEQDVVSRFVGKGLSGFVQKPYSAADLLPMVRQVLGESA